MKVLLSLLFVGLLCCAQVTRAQYYPPAWGAMGSNNYRHASTVQEGARRGMADVIRSSGAANLMHSEAAKNYEQARSSYLDNRLKATQTYFEMRRVNKQARAAERGQPVSQEQLIRYSKTKLPDRLTHTQLDPLTGSLNWPLMLRGKDFEPDRKRLEALFGERANEGYLDPDQFTEVRSLTVEMTNELKPLARNYPGSVSIEARKFLESLAFEAGFQAG